MSCTEQYQNNCITLGPSDLTESSGLWTPTEEVNSVCFVNQGTNSVKIFDIVLTQNQSICFDGDPGQCDKTSYRIEFVAGAGTDKLVVFTKRIVKTC